MNRAQLGDDPSMYEMMQFCWKTQALGLNGFKTSTKWLNDCSDSLMLLVVFIVLTGIVVIILSLWICTVMCGQDDDRDSETQSKKEK